MAHAQSMIYLEPLLQLIIFLIGLCYAVQRGEVSIALPRLFIHPWFTTDRAAPPAVTDFALAAAVVHSG